MIEIQHKNFREVLKFSLPFTTFVRLEEAWKDWTPLPVGHFLFQDTTGYSSNVRMPSSCGYRDLIPIVLSMFHPFFLCPFSSGCQMPMDKSTTGSLPGRHGSTEPQGACCARNPEASR